MENIENNTVEYQVHDNSDVEGSLLSAARKHFLSGNYTDALNLYLNALSAGANAKLYVDIGNCYFKLENNTEAIDYWNKAINLDPKNSQAYCGIGNLYYKDGHVDKAISMWLAALISRPEDAQACLSLAQAYHKKSLPLESTKYYEKYLKYAEDDKSETYKQIRQKTEQSFQIANECLAMAVQYHSEHDEQKALNFYMKSWEAYPNIFTTNMNMGSIFFADKKIDMAIKYWTYASHIEPNNSKVYSNLAISYDMLRMFNYAYCNYYKYMNFMLDNKAEYYKANSRLVKIKPFINKNQELVQEHLEKGNYYLSRAEYFDAIDEFKNYSILSHENQAQYKEMAKKLESYMNPELEIISTCLEKGNQLFGQAKYSDAKWYFLRVMRLSSPQYSEYSKAKVKYAQCEKTEKDMF